MSPRISAVGLGYLGLGYLGLGHLGLGHHGSGEFRRADVTDDDEPVFLDDAGALLVREVLSLFGKSFRRLAILA
jgi:hypothetical protein